MGETVIISYIKKYKNQSKCIRLPHTRARTQNPHTDPHKCTHISTRISEAHIYAARTHTYSRFHTNTHIIVATVWGHMLRNVNRTEGGLENDKEKSRIKKEW